MRLLLVFFVFFGGGSVIIFFSTRPYASFYTVPKLLGVSVTACDTNNVAAFYIEFAFNEHTKSTK